MKKTYYLVFLLTIILSSAHAQVKDWVMGAGFITEPLAVRTLANNRWLVVGRGNPSPGQIYSDTLFCVVLDQLGNVQYRHNLQVPSDEVHDLYDAIATPDGGFVLVTESTLCDAGGWLTVMQRFNAAGQLLWQRNGGGGTTNYIPQTYHLTPDGNLIGVLNTAVRKINLNDGADIWNATLPLISGDYIRSYTLAPGSEDLIMSIGATVQYWKQNGVLGQTASFIKTHTTTTSQFSAFGKMLPGPNGDYFVLDDNYFDKGFVRFNPLAETYEKIPVSVEYLLDYALTANGILVLYQEASNAWLTKYDFSGQILDTWARQEPWVSMKAFDLSDNQLYIAGGSGSGPKSNPDDNDPNTRFDTRHLWMRAVVINDFELPAPASDAAISDIEQQTPVHLDSTTSINGTGYFFYGGQFKIKVTNAGTNTLEKVDLLIGFENVLLWECGNRPAYRKQYSGLHLAPGASVWLDFGDVDVNYQYHAPAQFCFWTAAPNESNDGNHGNDVFCLSPQTTNVMEAPIAGIEVFPNPVTNGFWLKASTGNSLPDGYELYNVLGNNVQNGTIPGNTERYFVDLGLLSQGVYILKTGVLVQKIILQR
ncbi:MAG: T9SS type A sorting domain-containing protein [Bacteroidota bacterium]